MKATSRRTLVLRFGTIGDFISALSFCDEHGDYDLFLSRSVEDLLLNRVSDLKKIVELAPYSSDTDIYVGTLSELVRVVKENDYETILIHCQSDRGMRLMAIEFFLSKFCRQIFGRRILVKRFYHGGQYFHMINSESKVKTLLRELPKRPRISIFYDGKESAKNLDVKTIIHVCNVLNGSLVEPVITIYGSARLELPPLRGVNNIAGLTKIDEIAKVFDNTDLAVTCDSGPMHVFSSRGIPCVAFMSGRHELLNWTPLTTKNFYIYDDRLECIGCHKAKCPRGENICVNSEVTRAKFNELFE